MRKNIFLICWIILFYVCSLNAKVLAVDKEHVNDEKVIDAFEEYFYDNGIDVYEEIENMIVKYENIAADGDLTKRSKANNIISTILELEKSITINKKKGWISLSKSCKYHYYIRNRLF